MKITLKIWRQKNVESAGKFIDYEIKEVSPDSSFLEMIDVLNEELSEKGEEPVAFEHDCRNLKRMKKDFKLQKSLRGTKQSNVKMP